MRLPGVAAASGGRTGCAGRQAELNSQRDLQAVLVHQSFVAEDPLGQSVGVNLPFVEHNHAIAQFDDQVQIVGRDDLAALERFQNARQRPPGSRVEIVSVSFPQTGEGARMIEGAAGAAASELVELLRTEARVL